MISFISVTKSAFSMNDSGAPLPVNKTIFSGGKSLIVSKTSSAVNRPKETATFISSKIIKSLFVISLLKDEAVVRHLLIN